MTPFIFLDGLTDSNGIVDIDVYRCMNCGDILAYLVVGSLDPCVDSLDPIIKVILRGIKEAFDHCNATTRERNLEKYR